MHTVPGESSKPPRYRDQMVAALRNRTGILSDIFSGPDIHRPFNVLRGDLDRCYRDDRAGRLLWIYRSPAVVFPPFIGNPCRTFIIELSSDANARHAEEAEQLVRQKVGDTFVPKRLLTMEVLYEYKFQVTVYESVDGVKNLSHLWKSRMRSCERRRVVEDLMEMKRTLCFVGPSSHGGCQSSLYEHLNASVSRMAFDLNVLCDEGHDKREPAVLTNAKPILSLLNRHIPPYCRGKADVAEDGQHITLSLGNRSVVFTSQEIRYLRDSAFLCHKMAYPHDVFIQGRGKSCKVVAVLGWESAEFCPSGYGMGERDSMLGEEISDTAWYLSIRRKGLSRRTAMAATCQPAQSKLADTVHLLHTFSPPVEVPGGVSRRDKWMRRRKFRWMGGSVGWGCSWTAELRNLFHDRCSPKASDSRVDWRPS